MNHLMIDIETLDNKPTSAVVSIGAVRFDPKAGTISDFGFYKNVDAASSQAAGLTMSADTVMWWMQQSEEARKALVGGKPLDVALAYLDQEAGEIDCVWAHSPSFDLVILENAYRAVGKKAPWTHRQHRCTRTLYDLAGIDLIGFTAGTYHNALDDARNQAVAVIAAYRSLGLSI